MIDINQLNEKFKIEGVLTFKKLKNNLICLVVSNQYADATISLYGAQITSFRPKKEVEILWLSPMSYYEEGKAIRGGIPVCFPWFGPHKSDPAKPQHGFGRLMYWELMEVTENTNGETLIRLELTSSEITKTYWPYEFIAEMTFTIGKTLKVTLKVTNTSPIQFDYSCALHTYFNLSAIEDITIEGLKGTRYYKNGEPEEFIQESSKLKIHQVEDRHYYDTSATCFIEDPKFRRKIMVAKSGSMTTTVWNPGAANCHNTSDMPNEAYRRFVCIEAVNSLNDTVCITPGESHETSAVIGLKE